MRKFTAIPGKGILAGSRIANKRSIIAAEGYEYGGNMFTARQMDEINEGLESEVDVSIYADPKFNWDQMREIREGLEQGLDISIYADPKFDEDQMQQIRLGLQSGVDVSQYADTKFRWPQMEEIRRGLEAGVDVSQYADPEFDWKQMREIREQMSGTSKPTSESKKSQIKNLQKALEQYEAEDTTYTAFENFWSDILSEYEQPIDAELDIEYETSSRGGGEGTITFWHDGKTLWKDLEDWTETERELVEENPTPAKYKKAYKQMLLDMINNEDWESTDEDDWEK